MRIIDAGANTGQFAATAARIFPDAAFDLIEPQPECVPGLERFAAAHGRARIHRQAVTAPGVARVSMHRGGDAAASTGAFIPSDGAPYSTDLDVAATTLDTLFAGEVSPGDRALLKLDLEGHELIALSGASALLQIVEVLYVEISFYEAAGGTLFLPLANFVAARGFDLFDFGMLSARPREGRLRIGDAVFVRHNSALVTDVAD